MVEELLKHTGSEPLYQQAAAYLRKRLANGTYPPASALPSEMDLMALLNVSRPTVRHALEILIDEGLIERVPGRGTYVAETPAKAATRRTGCLGLIVMEMRDYFLMRIVNGAEYAASQKGYRLLLCNSGNDIGIEQQHLRGMWEEGKVDGFLIMPADSPQAHRTLAEFVADGVPLVLMDRYFDDSAAPFVASDDLRGGYLIAQHLIALGHRRIGFVSRPNLYVSSVALRLQGYRQALEEAGLGYDPNLVFQGLLPYLSEVQVLEKRSPRLAQFEQAAIRGLLERADRPTALFACNDIIAIQVMEVCRELGLRIPEDIALVGYADEAVASLLTPALTTVRQQPYEIGAQAARRLLDILDGRPVERETFLPVELVVRRSCGSSG